MDKFVKLEGKDLTYLADPKLKLRTPIRLTMGRYGANFYTAAWEEVEAVGFGDTQEEAEEDLRQELAELYWWLDELKARLGPNLQRIQERMAAVIYVEEGY